MNTDSKRELKCLHARAAGTEEQLVHDSRHNGASTNGKSFVNGTSRAKICPNNGVNGAYAEMDVGDDVCNNRPNGLTSKANGYSNGHYTNGIMEFISNGNNHDHVTKNGDAKPEGINASSKKRSRDGEVFSVSNGINGDMNGVSPAHDVQADSHQFLQKMTEFMLEHARRSSKRDGKVVNFRQPHDLKEALDLDIGVNGTNDDRLMTLVREICGYTVNTSHPHFFNQLYAGADEYSLAGACLTEVLNISLYTYEISTVFTIIEDFVIKKLMSYIGFAEGDGMFCPGGSMSNIFSLHLAKHYKFPEIRQRGLAEGPRLCSFTSDQSHYSVLKSTFFLGIGTDNLVNIRSDERAKMIPSELEKAIVEAKQQGKTPFYVNATAGTTVVGAYDPLNEIADICERYGLWLHVDACWGGAALVSKTKRWRLDGIHRADSVAWNPHKLLGAPLQCCGLFTKHKGLLKGANSTDANYLFQQDKYYDMKYDSGDATVQCSRKVDSFKFWLSLKARGESGLEARINTIWDNARHLTEMVKNTTGFRLIYEPECTNVCFYFIPKSMRGMEESSDWWQRLSKVAPEIKRRMIMKGSLMVTYTPNQNWVNFFRMVVINPRTTHQDMDFVLEEIARLGDDL